MSRVRTVRGIRALVSSPVASTLLGIALALYLSLLVSIGDVVANTMAHLNWSERFSYAISSLLHSRIMVQTIAGLIAVVSFASLVNSLRKIPVRRIFFMFGSTQ